MTDNNHTITPPPELVQHWLENYFGCVVSGELSDSEKYLATQAARWGADQELEACCEWFLLEGWDPDHPNKLRADRRALEKPSLKDQGLKALDSFEGFTGSLEEVDIIRRALESLPD